MTTLLIKDLTTSADLDSSAMTTISGGCYQCATGKPFSAFPFGGPSLSVATNDMNFGANQQLGQSQNTVVNNGNNAAFVSGITSNVNPTQNGSNNISLF